MTGIKPEKQYISSPCGLGGNFTDFGSTMGRHVGSKDIKVCGRTS